LNENSTRKVGSVPGGIFSYKEFSELSNVAKESLIDSFSLEDNTTIDPFIWQHACEEFECGGHE
jgi:hypothetical protein